MNFDNEVKVETAKGSIAVIGASLAALTLQEWVALATLVYIVLQVGLLLPKYYGLFKKKPAKEEK